MTANAFTKYFNGIAVVIEAETDFFLLNNCKNIFAAPYCPVCTVSLCASNNLHLIIFSSNTAK